MNNAFCSYKIASSSSHPTLWDLLVLLVWSKTNPAMKHIWQYFGQLVWPQAMWVYGRVIDALALSNSKKPVEQLPLLKTAKGKSRRTPWVNKLVLLQKMRRIRAHRKNTMQSHQDLVPQNSQIVAAEQFLCASLYARKVRQAYQDAFHFTVAWDPSGYDVETLVSIIHSTQAGEGPDGLAAYLPIQNLKPVLKQEVCEEIRALSSANKLTRIQGYCEIRALSHSLQAIDMPLGKFFLPKDVHWKQLQEFEKRVFENDCWWIVNSRTGAKVRQLPTTFEISKTPILCSLSDQGGINRAGLDYLCWKLGMSIHIAFDPYHRSWNDLKHSLRSSKGDLWRCLLSYSLLYNVNYGPFGSKQWHDKKQQRAQELLQSASAHKEPFLSYIPFICQERQIEEPTTASGREKLLESLAECNSIRTLGPVVKIMRFYSFFQSSKFFEGEVWFTKLVMLESDSFTATEGTSYVRSEESMIVPGSDSNLTDKQQLQQLKLKHGSWGLAPLLVTPASFWQKEAIVLLANPCWAAHSWMSKHVVTPTNSARYTIAKSQGGWKEEILELVLQGFYSTSNLKRLYPFQGTSEATKKARLGIHLDLVVNLMAKRGSSLSAHYLRPPIRYASLLSNSEAEVRATQQQMLKEWKLLLDLEEQDLAGKHVRSLASLHFLQGVLCRVSFLLNEDDSHKGSHEAAKLLKPLLVNFGDTLCVENTHQSAKDCMRESRHNVRSRVNKQCAVINSRLFQTRQTEHVSIPELELSLASAKGMPPFIPLTHPNGHVMQKQFQQMMQHKSGDHWWPSTSAATQFEEVVSLEYLLSKLSLDAPQLTCLVGGPGGVIACVATSVVYLVLSRASSGFLAWAMEAVPGSNPAAFRCIPQQSALQFHYVHGLNEWVDIPVQPSLHHEHGGLVLEKTGDPMPLAQARIAKGLDLSVKEAKEVLFACNVKLPGQPSKAQVYRALIEHFVTGEEEIQRALELSSAKLEKEEDDDRLSELAELIELLEADTDLQQDPDVRNDQRKIKKRQMANPKVPEGSMLLGPTTRGRGGGRGRGRPKGSGKGRGIAGKFAKAKAKAKSKAKSKKPDKLEGETAEDANPEAAKTEEAEAAKTEEPEATLAPLMAGSSDITIDPDCDYVPTSPDAPTSPGEWVPELALPEAPADHPPKDQAEPPTLATTTASAAAAQTPEHVEAVETAEHPSQAVPGASLGASLAVEHEAPTALAEPSASQAIEHEEESQAPGAKEHRPRGPNVFASPSPLGRISPPGCNIRLNGT